jgi:diacylglycerol kinase family enzyme
MNKRTSEKSGNLDSADSVHSVENNGSASRTSPNSRKVYIDGELHRDIRVPLFVIPSEIAVRLGPRNL